MKPKIGRTTAAAAATRLDAANSQSELLRSLEALANGDPPFSDSATSSGLDSRIVQALNRIADREQQLRQDLEQARAAAPAEQLNSMVAQLKVAHLPQDLLTAQRDESRRALAELDEETRQLSEERRELALAKSKLQEREQALKLTSRRQSELLSNMAHELRNPLNSSLILAQILAENAEGRLSQKQVSFARTIYNSGVDLLALINDILDLAKIESGTLSVSVQAAWLAALQAEVQRMFEEVAAAKGLEFRVAIDGAAPPVVGTDARRLRQVLINLISNALKFTDSGSVTLRIGAAAWPSPTANPLAPTAIAFEVIDTGIGVAPDQQAVIFEPFRQAEGVAARPAGGTGLGLSISRELARLLGGDILVRSEPGHGSTFTLYLPALPAPVDALFVAPERHAASSTGTGRPWASGGKVLLVGGNIRNLFALTSLLEHHNLTVTRAESSSRTLEILALDDSFDFAVVDGSAAGMDSCDTIRRIRDELGIRTLKIAAVIPDNRPQTRERCRDAGATECLPQPLKLEDLAAVLAAWVPQRPSELMDDSKYENGD